MILTALAFAHFANVCDARDSVRTLAAVASVESRFHPLAIHDNSTNETLSPSSVGEAVAIATVRIVKEGHSVDLGLMQIDSANLPRIGLTIPEAFDPCRSIQAGARILRNGYENALRVAFSRYNTGSPVRGLSNGYVQRVELASQALPDLSRPDVGSVPLAPLPPAVPASPAAVIDLLHGARIGPASGEVVNLLPIMAEQESPPVTARPRTSAASEGQAVD